MTDDGTVLEPEGALVFGGPDFDTTSAVVWDGVHFVASARLSLVRVTRNGVVVDATGVPEKTAGLVGLAAGPPSEVALLVHRSISEGPYDGTMKVFIRFFHDVSG